MKNVNFLFANSMNVFLAAALASGVSLALSGSTGTAAEKPNIIVVLVDDMGFAGRDWDYEPNGS